SLLYGDTNAAILGATVPVGDQTFVTWEMQLGVEYRHELSMGDVFVRAGFEAQLWDVPTIALGLFDGDVSLYGPSFAVGLTY
ncbi:MAG: hypothetical protein N2C12_10390, partial [Planctomycetales bacterium]